MHKGMATWMHAWSRLIEPEVRSDSTGTNGPQQCASDYSKVVAMLAKMTLSASREVI
jgi:hypothetical protein